MHYFILPDSEEDPHCDCDKERDRPHGRDDHELCDLGLGRGHRVVRALAAVRGLVEALDELEGSGVFVIHL